MFPFQSTNLNFHLLFQDVDEILKFIEGGKETKKERKNSKKERQRRDSGKREERIQRVESTKIKFSDETLASMQPTKTYIDPSNRVGDVKGKEKQNKESNQINSKKLKSTPKDRANLELKRSGIEIDESEIDNGIITVTCHKSSALAAAQQAIKELEELRSDVKQKEDAIDTSNYNGDWIWLKRKATFSKDQLEMVHAHLGTNLENSFYEQDSKVLVLDFIEYVLSSSKLRQYVSEKLEIYETLTYSAKMKILKYLVASMFEERKPLKNEGNDYGQKTLMDSLSNKVILTFSLFNHRIKQ